MRSHQDVDRIDLEQFRSPERTGYMPGSGQFRPRFPEPLSRKGNASGLREGETCTGGHEHRGENEP